MPIVPIRRTWLDVQQDQFKRYTQINLDELINEKANNIEHGQMPQLHLKKVQ